MNKNFLASVEAAFMHAQIIDLSHDLVEGIPKFPTHSSFKHIPAQHSNDPAVMFRLEIHEHSGTHVDAPIHLLTDTLNFQSLSPTVDGIGLGHLIGIATLVCIEMKAGELVTKRDLEVWQETKGLRIDTPIVLFNFGWYRKWSVGDPGEAFVNGWPGLSREVTNFLLDAGVKAVGTDCLGMDSHDSHDYPAHDILLKNNILIVENLRYFEDLPDRFFFIALPLNISGGSGSPIRAIGLVERK